MCACVRAAGVCVYMCTCVCVWVSARAYTRMDVGG